MAFLMSDDASAIKATPSVEAEINAAQSVSQISEILHRAALDQKLYEPDPYDRDGKDWSTMRIVPQPAQQAAQTAALSKTITVNGITYALTGTAEDLTRLETELYRAALQTKTAPSQEQPRDAASGRFVEQHVDDAAETNRLADLQLRFQLGQLDAASYIRESGAITSYLNEQGVDIDALKEFSATKQTERVEKSWASATEEFLQGAGASWPGGTANQQKIGEVLLQMDAAESPSAENLARAFAYMRSNGLIDNTESQTHEAISSARTPEELREALGYRGDSAMWGR